MSLAQSQNRTSRPALTASIPIATARWVFPLCEVLHKGNCTKPLRGSFPLAALFSLPIVR